ncbi:phosphoenolpyruvate carboxykinase (GTP) [Microbacterium alcoholitolerans]|uniref:phosphoenolpyruvate carboxykinase (GTP) n=1 Tax=unclassified Microbacterium TaxID=2609290 RepID=UPI003D162E12
MRSALPSIPTGAHDCDLWVAEVAALTRPDRVVWYYDTPDERAALLAQSVADGKLIKLDPNRRPGSYLARSDAGDVARVEARTFICSESEADAGPTNNWRDPQSMRTELAARFAGAMRGRTMFVVPFSMGVADSSLARYGLQVTDSAYAALSMGMMTRVSRDVRTRIDEGAHWVPTVHSVGAPLADDDTDTTWPSNTDKYIAHFPETREVWSYGSGYGGNALLAKKCFALRIASVLGRDEGWLAEHMLLVRLTSPEGRPFHIAAAFPSACGKTNLSMLQPTLPGWKVETLGDDIVWMRPGGDGRMWAINPEAGFFGVAPGTGPGTNPVATQMIERDTIFTNVALTPERDVWWEGLSPAPAELTDWQGQPWQPGAGTPAAHPNSRFTVSASACPLIADEYFSGRAVPLDAILFGGRRATTTPLVVEAYNWDHGVFMGATMASEQTAAAEGTVGRVRRDPFAMLPFCGYNMADYWEHWLTISEQLDPAQAPRIFQVNWFRRGESGDFLWPGFGDNARVLAWICRRVAGQVSASSSPVGMLPTLDDLDVEGLDLTDEARDQLLAVNGADWAAETSSIDKWFNGFDGHVPTRILEQLEQLAQRLTAVHESGAKTVAGR